MQNSARGGGGGGGAAARGAGVRPPTEITRRHFFPTAPSHMSSATVERPAPIARQRACGAQRRKSQCHPHVPKPLKPVVGSASLSSSLSHRAARRRCKRANTQSERLAPPASPRSPLVIFSRRIPKITTCACFWQIFLLSLSRRASPPPIAFHGAPQPAGAKRGDFRRFSAILH